jgi:hypothetical protein
MSEVITFTSPGTPTITEMDRVAETISTAVKAVASIIPGLQIPHDLARRQVRAQRTVPREFIESMIAAAEQVESLRALGKFDIEDAREALRFIDAFRPVADQLQALVDALKFTFEWRKARAAAGALLTYGIGRELARDEHVTPLTAHNEFLKRDLRREQKSGKGARRAGSPTRPDGSADPSYAGDLHPPESSARETSTQTHDRPEDPAAIESAFHENRKRGVARQELPAISPLAPSCGDPRRSHDSPQVCVTSSSLCGVDSRQRYDNSDLLPWLAGGGSESMSNERRSTLPNADMQAAPQALLRAARRAREIARQTNTAIVIVRDGVLIEEWDDGNDEDD